MKSVISFFEKHAIGILSLTVIIVAGYTTVGLQASDALRKATANEKCIKEQGEKLNRIASTAERDIAVIQANVKNINLVVTEIKTEQKLIGGKIDQILLRSLSERGDP